MCVCVCVRERERERERGGRGVLRVRQKKRDPGYKDDETAALLCPFLQHLRPSQNGLIVPLPTGHSIAWRVTVGWGQWVTGVGGYMLYTKYTGNMSS